MSTYLLAFIVSDFECKEGYAEPPAGRVNVSVCARPTANSQLTLAYNSSVTAIEFFEDFYKIAYPLPKLGIAYLRLRLVYLHTFLAYFCFLLDHIALADIRFGGKCALLLRVLVVVILKWLTSHAKRWNSGAW